MILIRNRLGVGALGWVVLAAAGCASSNDSAVGAAGGGGALSVAGTSGGGAANGGTGPNAGSGGTAPAGAGAGGVGTAGMAGGGGGTGGLAGGGAGMAGGGTTSMGGAGGVGGSMTQAGAAGQGAGGTAPTGQGAWQAGPPLPDTPRAELGVAAIGDVVYAIGGHNNLVTAFDTKTQQWKAMAPLPKNIDHANVAAVGGKIYVVGATFGENTKVGDGDAFLVFDPKLNQWSKIAIMPDGTDRGASGVAVIGTKIYVVGGWKNYGKATTDFSAYDTATDTWEKLPDLPLKRDHLVAGAVGGIVYMIGGRDGTIGGTTGRVDAFDPNNKAAGWTPRKPMITARGGTAGIVLFNQIYVFGGEGNPAQGSNGVYPQTEVYNPATDSWRALANMLVPKHGIYAAEVAGKVYLPGGADHAGGGSPITSMEIFTP